MKTKALLASLALVAVALAPLALAHNDPTPWVLDDVDGNATDDGNAVADGDVSFEAATLNHVDMPTNGDVRVSGVYYKDVSLLVNLTTEGVNLPDDTPTDVTNVTGDPAGTNFLLGVANALCDMEVLSPGDGSADELDEPEVDGLTNAASQLGLTLFNDGGAGAVCHTHKNYYAHNETDPKTPGGDWNTPGCDYDPAFGDDAVSDRVWLTTVCDYGHGTSGVSLVSYVLSCANNLLTNDVNGLVTCASALAACVVTVVGTNPCPLTTGFACGDDGSGSGGITTPGNSGWSDVGVPFEDVPNPPCTDIHGAAAVFVWTAVFVDLTDDPVTGVEHVSVPTVGVIY